MASRKFPALGIQVTDDGAVRTYTGLGRGKLLGMLDGAHAEVSEAGSVKAGRAVAHSLLSGPAGLIMGRRDSYAFISFMNGELHEVKIQGKSNWRTAQQEALRFNLLAELA